MAKVEVEHLFKGNLQQVYQGIIQYDKYIKYLDDISELKVLPSKDPKAFCAIEWHIQIIKDIHYTINMYHEEPTKISWKLVESNILKTNNGSWELSAQSPQKTLAKYSVEVAAKFFLPGGIIESLTRSNLPAMFAGMQKLISAQSKSSAVTKKQSPS